MWLLGRLFPSHQDDQSPKVQPKGEVECLGFSKNKSSGQRLGGAGQKAPPCTCG